MAELPKLQKPQPGTAAPSLHISNWPLFVGKGKEEGQEPPVSFERGLELFSAAKVEGEGFFGMDYFFLPGTTDDQLRQIAKQVKTAGFQRIGSMVAPIWGGPVLGTDEDRKTYLQLLRETCHAARVFNGTGMRQYGVIRLDTGSKMGQFGKEFNSDPDAAIIFLAEHFAKASDILRENGERGALEMEVCWAGMQSPAYLDQLLDEISALTGIHDSLEPGFIGAQGDLAHILTAMLGINAPAEHAFLPANFFEGDWNEDELYAAMDQVVDLIGDWVIDFHVAQNDGTVHGAGSHDPTGKHCTVKDPNGKLDVVRAASLWVKSLRDNGVKHICWDGCMFPNATLETPQTWQDILAASIGIRDKAWAA